MSMNIIIISLTADINSNLSTSLDTAQYRVVTCSSLTEARQRLGDETYRLIVYNVPPVSSHEACEAVSSLRRLSYAPMLVLAPDEVVERLLEAGADCCLPPETGRDRAAAYARALIRRYTLYIQLMPSKCVSN